MATRPPAGGLARPGKPTARWVFCWSRRYASSFSPQVGMLAPAPAIRLTVGLRVLTGVFFGESGWAPSLLALTSDRAIFTNLIRDKPSIKCTTNRFLFDLKNISLATVITIITHVKSPVRHTCTFHPRECRFRAVIDIKFANYVHQLMRVLADSESRKIARSR